MNYSEMFETVSLENEKLKKDIEAKAKKIKTLMDVSKKALE